jgi:hypothetical protein
MDLPRLLLTFSVASFVMLAPFVFTFALYSERLRYAFFYLSVCSLSFSMWALSRYECIYEQHKLSRAISSPKVVASSKNSG